MSSKDKTIFNQTDLDISDLSPDQVLEVNAKVMEFRLVNFAQVATASITEFFERFSNVVDRLANSPEFQNFIEEQRDAKEEEKK